MQLLWLDAESLECRSGGRRWKRGEKGGALSTSA